MPPSSMEVGHVICPIQSQALDLFHRDVPTYEIVVFIGYHGKILHRNYIFRRCIEKWNTFHVSFQW